MEGLLKKKYLYLEILSTQLVGPNKPNSYTFSLQLKNICSTLIVAVLTISVKAIYNMPQPSHKSYTLSLQQSENIYSTLIVVILTILVEAIYNMPQPSHSYNWSVDIFFESSLTVNISLMM